MSLSSSSTTEDSSFVYLSLDSTSSFLPLADFQVSLDRRDLRSDYKTVKLLGEGSFGAVFLVELHKTGDQYVLKLIKYQKDADTGLLDVHPRVINLYRAFEAPGRGALYLLFELAHGGTLEEFVEERAGLLQETHIAHIMKEVLEGVEYFHECGIMHCDIKPANILLTNGGHIKIANFGIAIPVPSREYRSTRYGGSPGYMAPEVESSTEKGFNQAIDIYALGVLADWFCAVGLSDYKDTSPAVRAFVQLSTAKDPESRPTAKELLQHDFITQTTSDAANDLDRMLFGTVPSAS
ncbi:hypothetical protein BOTBODRAFT_180882 [Botryobasidium botryosum FD-172 SS1]|uniref:non-specific serine/threonine protein kinase n=1 Tax=Botryobasidium botryosum (strain FD-172 SS1) TaxID=930990 RepID=A0A067LXX9_BOTB1|nr:hypothetical protein BOTBODRAFT_180882 [Botryobasidium botryosum FD-172 SS1]